MSIEAHDAPTLQTQTTLTDRWISTLEHADHLHDPATLCPCLIHRGAQRQMRWANANCATRCSFTFETLTPHHAVVC